MNRLDENVAKQLPWKDGVSELVHEDPEPQLLICTPLGTADHNSFIAESTKRSILDKNKDIRVLWYSFKSHFNCAGNKNFAFHTAKTHLEMEGKRLPPYLCFCNRDIEWTPWILEGMINKLSNYSVKKDRVGYCYGQFQRYGEMNCTIRSPEFDINHLVFENFIDNNCIFHTKTFDNYIRFDTTLNNYDDYDLFLSLALYCDIKGILYAPDVNIFRTETSKNDISFGPKWFWSSTTRLREKHLDHIVSLNGGQNPGFLNARMEEVVGRKENV